MRNFEDHQNAVLTTTNTLTLNHRFHKTAKLVSFTQNVRPFGHLAFEPPFQFSEPIGPLPSPSPPAVRTELAARNGGGCWLEALQSPVRCTVRPPGYIAALGTQSWLAACTKRWTLHKTQPTTANTYSHAVSDRCVVRLGAEDCGKGEAIFRPVFPLRWRDVEHDVELSGENQCTTNLIKSADVCCSFLGSGSLCCCFIFMDLSDSKLEFWMNVI